jgi:hypothetical protein
MSYGRNRAPLFVHSPESVGFRFVSLRQSIRAEHSLLR